MCFQLVHGVGRLFIPMDRIPMDNLVGHPRDYPCYIDSEIVMLAREKKRKTAIDRIKGESYPEAYARFKLERASDEPKTPDPCDRQVSKRTWEASTMRFRAQLRAYQ